MRSKFLKPLIILLIFTTFYIINNIPYQQLSLENIPIEHNNKIDVLNDSSRLHFDPNEKFITYLPHSGFHNQRISLENAIFLSYYLNRTLILPPIIVLKGIPHIYATNFDDLYHDLEKLNPHSNNFTYCKIGKCKNVQYTLYHWDELMNFRWVQQQSHIKLIYRRDFSLTSLLSSLNINENEVIFIKDKFQYHYKFYDNSSSIVSLGKFRNKVNLSELKRNYEDKKLIHFGNIFSNQRIVKELPKSTKFWDNLLQELTPVNNQILIKITQDIINQLGGKGNFIGAHARLRHFFHPENVTINTLSENIKFDYYSHELHDFPSHENKLFNSCKKKLINPDTIPLVIYIASDKDKSDPDFEPFLDKYPCTFTLSDFKQSLEPLKKAINPLDNTNMEGFLIPLVDLLVSSHGSRFYGTKKSTFSVYAERLHNLAVES